MDKPDAILSGIPVGTPGYRPGDDYVAKACELCGTQFWMGPTGLQMKREFPEMPVICIVCAHRIQPDWNVESLT